MALWLHIFKKLFSDRIPTEIFIIMPGVCFKNILATAKQILCVVELSGE